MPIRSHWPAWVLILALGSIALPAVAGEQKATLYKPNERALGLVVRITGANTDGAGIIYHVDEHYAYGVTAKHVVLRQNKKLEGLNALFWAWPGRQVPIEATNFHYQEDLAAFRADLRPLGLSLPEYLRGIPLDQLGVSEGLDPGVSLSSVGHATAGAWISPERPVRFARGDGQAFLFEYDCPQGHSGGGVFDDQWRLVGMMINEERPYCRALRIEPILKIVQGWKLSISLVPPPPKKTDKPLAKPITVAVVDFDNRSGRDLPSLGFMAQDQTTTALYDVPGVTLVTRDRIASLRQEHQLPGSLESSQGISLVGKLLKADVLVTGAIQRYEVERRTFEGFGTSALQDTSLMAISLQILDVETGQVRFSKNFDIERTKQYPKANSAPQRPIDLTSELLEELLQQAKTDMRSALAQVASGLGRAGQFVQVPVTSRPAGADVILNGAYMGSTPLTLQLTLDEHEVGLELAGHGSWRRRVKVQPGMTIDVNLLVQRP